MGWHRWFADGFVGARERIVHGATRLYLPGGKNEKEGKDHTDLREGMGKDRAGVGPEFGPHLI